MFWIEIIIIIKSIKLTFSLNIDKKTPLKSNNNNNNNNEALI